MTVEITASQTQSRAACHVGGGTARRFEPLWPCEVLRFNERKGQQVSCGTTPQHHPPQTQPTVQQAPVQPANVQPQMVPDARPAGEQPATSHRSSYRRHARRWTEGRIIGELHRHGIYW